MYEDNHPPLARRILWLGLWFILIVAVAWIAVWLVFFHHSGDTKKVTVQPPKATTGQQTPAGSNASTSGSSGSSSSPSSSSTAPSQSGNAIQSPPSTTAPTQLANTGPGNLILPVTLAVVVGSGMQYIRIRKKLVV